MKYRHPVLVVTAVTATFATLFAVHYYIQRDFSSKELWELNAARSALAVVEARNALKQELESVADAAAQFAGGEQVKRSLDTGNRVILDDHLSRSVVASYSSSFVYLYNPAGQLIYRSISNIDSDAALGLDALVGQGILPGHPWLQPIKTAKAYSGVMVIGHQPYLMAIVPISKTQVAAEGVALLIVGRLLDEAVGSSIKARASVISEVYDMQEAEQLLDLQKLVPYRSDQNTLLPERVMRGNQTAYCLVPDIAGQSALVLEVKSNELQVPGVSERIVQTASFSLLCSIFALLLLALLMNYLLNKRIAAVQDYVVTLGQEETAEEIRVPFGGKDKLALLAAQIDTLLTSSLKLERETIGRIQTESALRGSEYRYQQLVEHMGEGLVVLNVYGEFTFHNPAAERIMGVEPGLLSGRYLSDFLLPEDAATADELVSYKSERNINTYELIIKRPDGETREVVFTMTPHFNEDGTFHGGMGILRDVSVQQSAERAAKKSEQDFRYLVEAMGQGLIVLDQNGIITYANDRMCEMLGCDNLLSHHVLEYFEEPSRLLVKNHFKLHLGEQRTIEVDWKNNSKGTTSALMSPVPIIDDNGTLQGVFAVVTDITPRKEMEIALRDSEERIQAVFEAAEDIIYMKDVHHRYKQANRQLQQVYGLPLYKIIGYSDSELLGHANSSATKAIEERVLAGEIVSEKSSKSVNGQDRVFHSIQVPLRNSRNEIIGICGIARDVTEAEADQEALRISKQRYKDLAELLPQTIFEMNSKGYITYINKSGLDLLGHNGDSVAKGLNIHRFLRPERTNEFNHKFSAAMAGEDLELEIELLKESGLAVPCLLHARRIMHDSRSIGLRGIIIDISERKQTQLKIKRSEERIRRILATSNEGFWLLNNDDVISEVNQEVCRIVKRSTDELVGRPIQDLVSVASQGPFAEQLQKAKEGRCRAFETELIDKRGKSIPCLANATVLYDEEGAKIGSFAMITDMTDIKLAERLIARENSKLAAIINGLQAGIVLANSDARIIEVNEYFCLLTNKSRSEIINKSIWDMHSSLTGEKREQLELVLAALRESRGASPFEIQREFYDEEVIIRVQPVFSNYQYEGILLNVIPVTELVTARKLAEEANKAKSYFLAGMSHELRTPLSIINSNAEILLEEVYGRLTEKQRRYISRIANSGAILLAIIDDLLDLAKIESGRMYIEARPVNLATITKETCDMLRHMAVGKGLELEVIGCDAEVIYTGDALRLRQALLNLLSNAIKFTRVGSITVYLQKSGEFLHWGVKDTGIGIEESMKDKLFEPFVQASEDFRSKLTGTGLGLTLTKEIVQVHGGNVTVQSELGLGSDFCLVLPNALALEERNV